MPTITGKEVGITGYGLMGLTWTPIPPPQEQAFAAMRAALESGANFWNGGEIYGPPDANSLTLLREYFTHYPEDVDRVVLSIKGCMSLVPHPKPDGSREGVRRSVEQCLKDLGGTKTCIDIFESARVDASTPLEVTMGAFEELINEGKISGVSLSEVGEATVRKAAKMTKISAVEVELSMFSTEPLTNGVAKACAELGIPIIAYSPVGRGMLTGEIKSADDIPEGDLRRHLPRYHPDVFEHNIQLVKAVETLATARGCTTAQFALAWVRTLSKRNGNPEIIPIPGSTKESRVRENCKDIRLEESEMQAIAEILSKFEVKGGRYAKTHEHMLEL